MKKQSCIVFVFSLFVSISILAEESLSLTCSGKFWQKGVNPRTIDESFIASINLKTKEISLTVLSGFQEKRLEINKGHTGYIEKHCPKPYYKTSINEIQFEVELACKAPTAGEQYFPEIFRINRVDGSYIHRWFIDVGKGKCVKTKDKLF